MSEKFSLKDHLFNTESVIKFCNYFYDKDGTFPKKKFIKKCEEMFPKLELKQRIEYMTDLLEDYLPQDDFNFAMEILIQALPVKLDTKKTDDDFGEFILAPFSCYISRHGLSSKRLKKSLKTLREITMRFSVEFDIRFFLNEFPVETFAFLKKCAQDKNYHVRRLASEGLRPRLPWAKKIAFDYKKPIDILNLLYYDKTRYVTRSVANHMNDISKIDPDLVLKTLRCWKKSKQQIPEEMDFIIRHSLRTLVKQGDASALALLGYEQPADVSLEIDSIDSALSLGSCLCFAGRLVSSKDQNIMIGYDIYFRNKKGELKPKRFSLKKVSMKKNESLDFQKKHLIREMTTRKIYLGEHYLQLVVNGVSVGKKYAFTLTKN